MEKQIGNPDKIIEQLKHDVPFKWFLYNRTKYSQVISFKQIMRLRQRLYSELQLLRAIIQKGSDLINIFPMDDWGAVFVMAWLGFKTGKPEYWQKAVMHVNDKDTSVELRDAIVWVLKSEENGSDILEELSNHENVWVRHAFILSGVQPINEQKILSEYLSSSDPILITAAIEQMSYIAMRYELLDSKRFDFFLTHDNDTIRFHSIKLALLYANDAEKENLLAILRSYCQKENSHMKDAIRIFLVYCTYDAAELLVQDILSLSISSRIKIYTISESGLIGFIDKALSYMTDPLLASVAGNCVSKVTGIDIDDFTDNSIDSQELDNLETEQQTDPYYEDDEYNMPYPCVKSVRNWWERNGKLFDIESRYIYGNKYGEEGFRATLLMASQYDRLLAAMHLKRLYPENSLLDISISET